MYYTSSLSKIFYIMYYFFLMSLTILIPQLVIYFYSKQRSIDKLKKAFYYFLFIVFVGLAWEIVPKSWLFGKTDSVQIYLILSIILIHTLFFNQNWHKSNDSYK
jgi:uncharacterized membrane protein YhaH (DUF805 family)